MFSLIFYLDMKSFTGTNTRFEFWAAVLLHEPIERSESGELMQLGIWGGHVKSAPVAYRTKPWEMFVFEALSGLRSAII